MKRFVIFIIVFVSTIMLLQKCTTTKMRYGTGYYAPAWSPDGTRIYYFRNDLSVKETSDWPFSKTFEFTRNVWYIFSCDINGQNRKKKYKVGEFSLGGDWLPYEEEWRMIMDISIDGWIVYSVTTAIKNGIWLIDTIGNNDHQVLPWGMNPRWAYNYTKIVFEGDGDKEGIWIMDKDGGNVAQIINEGSWPAFCDVNQKMLYHFWPADGYGQLFCYSFVDSSIDTLIEGAWADWSSGGEKFVYFWGSGGYPRIFQFIDSSSTTIITPDKGYKVIRWSESNRIVSYDGGIWVMNPDGSGFKVIIYDDMDHLYLD